MYSITAAVFMAFSGFQIDDPGAGFFADLIEFFFADMLDVNLNVRPAYSDDAKAWFFFALFDLSSFTNKYFSCHFDLPHGMCYKIILT